MSDDLETFEQFFKKRTKFLGDLRIFVNQITVDLNVAEIPQVTFRCCAASSEFPTQDATMSEALKRLDFDRIQQGVVENPLCIVSMKSADNHGRFEIVFEWFDGLAAIR